VTAIISFHTHIMSLITNLFDVAIPEKQSDWPLAAWYAPSIGPFIPIGTAIAYFVTVHLLNPKAGEKRKPLLSGPLFTALVFAHSKFGRIVRRGSHRASRTREMHA